MFFQNWICGPPTLEKLSSSLGSRSRARAAKLAVFNQDGVSKVPNS